MLNIQEEMDRKCLCCSKGSMPFVFVFQHKSLINSLSEVLGFKVTREKYYPETLCYVCCCFINRVMEFRRLSQIRLNDFRAKAKLSGEEFVFNGLDKSTTDVSTSNADDAPPKPKMFGQNENFKNAGFSGPIIASVQTGVSLSPIAPDEDDEEVGSTINGDVSLLTVAFERPESVIDTESGGNICRQAQEEGQTSPTGIFTCPHCSKVYRKSLTLQKHVNKHVRKMAIQERCKRNRDAPSKSMKISQCRDCGASFESKIELRNHALVHKKRYDCSHCAKWFYSHNDYEWHQAACDGARRAKDVENSSINGRRKTRSRLSKPPDDDDTLSEYSVASTPSYSAKIQSINRWIQNASHHSSSPEGLDDTNDDDRLSVVSGLTNITNFSDFSSCSMTYGGGSAISVRTKYTSKSKSSVSDLMSARSSLSSRTMTRGNSREISKIDLELSFRGNAVTLHGDRMQQRNKKLIRLRNREAKQLMKNGSTVFLCSDCVFSCDSLAVMMQHEKKKHKKLALFKCTECIERFTQEKYLNQHVLMHPSGPFYCIHCEEHFDTKIELKLHLDLHLEKSHSCQYCDLSFLKLSQMKQHVLAAHLDRLNVHNGVAGEVATPKTGILDRVTFKPNASPLVRGSKAVYRAKTLVQKSSVELTRRKRRHLYPYLEKLGNVNTKLVQMIRSGQEITDPVTIDVPPPSTSVHLAKPSIATAPSPSSRLTVCEFQPPDEVVTDMDLEEHGIFSVNTIPDPDLAFDNSMQSPPSDNTPCSSNGNSPPYASPDNSPTGSPSKRSSANRKRNRLNVNSKRNTKQIVHNNFKFNHVQLEATGLPSYTEWCDGASDGSKKSKVITSCGPWR